MKRGVNADANTALVTVEASKWSSGHQNDEASTIDALVTCGRVKRAATDDDARGDHVRALLGVKRMRQNDKA